MLGGSFLAVNAFSESPFAMAIISNCMTLVIDGYRRKHGCYPPSPDNISYAEQYILVLPILGRADQLFGTRQPISQSA
jgi:hypothetical protein